MDRDTRLYSDFHAVHHSAHLKAYSCLLPSLPPQLSAAQLCQTAAAFPSQPQAAALCCFSFPICQWRSVFEQAICFADNAQRAGSSYLTKNDLQTHAHAGSPSNLPKHGASPCSMAASCSENQHAWRCPSVCYAVWEGSPHPVLRPCCLMGELCSR